MSGPFVRTRKGADASSDADADNAETAIPVIPGVAIETRIGAGGMGWVYKGRQTYLDRTVAVKVLRLKYGSDEGNEFVERFRREAKLLAELSEPHIVSCYDAGVSPGGECYLTMEYIDGSDLKELLDERGPVPIPVALRIISDLSLALGHALEKGIIHRDVKAANVMIRPIASKVAAGDPYAFEVKLTDLGLARYQATGGDAEATAAGRFFGTPLIMAPEQFDPARQVDHRTDIYALGCLLFLLITGEHPFAGKSLTDVLNKKLRAGSVDFTLLPPECDADLKAFIQKMINGDADRRPQTYAEIQTFCQQHISGEKPKRRIHPAITLSLTALVLLITFIPSYIIGVRRNALLDQDEFLRVPADNRPATDRPASAPAADPTATATGATDPTAANAGASSSSPAESAEPASPAPAMWAFAADPAPLFAPEYLNRLEGWTRRGSWGAAEDDTGVVGVGGRSWAMISRPLTHPAARILGSVDVSQARECAFGVRLASGGLLLLRCQNLQETLLLSLVTGDLDADGNFQQTAVLKGTQATVSDFQDYRPLTLEAANGHFTARFGETEVSTELPAAPTELVALVLRGNCRVRALSAYAPTPAILDLP